MIQALGKTLVAIVAAGAIVAGGGWAIASQTGLLSANPHNVISSLYSSGATSYIENTIRENEAYIANYLGMSVDEVDAVVDELDIPSWEVVDVPENVSAAKDYSYNYEGNAIRATLYDDPEYVTVSLNGEEVSLRISEGAQQYIERLQQ